MVDETIQAVWNFDGAELALLFQFKVDVSVSLKSWNLEEAYWALRDLRREIDAKLNRDKKEEIIILDEKGNKQKMKMTEKEVVDYLLNEVEKERNNFLEDVEDVEYSSRYYLVLESFYMHIAHLMKVHGLYFREGDDPSKAWMRR